MHATITLTQADATELLTFLSNELPGKYHASIVRSVQQWFATRFAADAGPPAVATLDGASLVKEPPAEGV